MSMEDLIHKRILIAEKESGFRSGQKIEEVKILEVSPSGNWVKIQNQNGQKFWKSRADIIPVEILGRLEKPSE